jgi:protein-S-isoprenylcysteine O-methyltransferase Ste14
VRLVHTEDVEALIAGSPMARAVLVASAVAFAIAEVLVRLRNTSTSRSTRVDRGSILAVVAGIAAGGILAGWFAATAPGWEIPGSWLIFAVAVVLIWCGIAIRQWAVLTLGPSFTVVVRVSEDQRVVDRGPFRWVRHPSYTGLLMTLAGLGLAVGNWLSLASLIVLPFIGVAARIRVEEAALMSWLPGYLEYSKGRARLIPGVW